MTSKQLFADARAKVILGALEALVEYEAKRLCTCLRRKCHSCILADVVHEEIRQWREQA